MIRLRLQISEEEEHRGEVPFLSQCYQDTVAPRLTAGDVHFRHLVRRCQPGLSAVKALAFPAIQSHH